MLLGLGVRTPWLGVKGTAGQGRSRGSGGSSRRSDGASGSAAAGALLTCIEHAVDLLLLALPLGRRLHPGRQLELLQSVVRACVQGERCRRSSSSGTTVPRHTRQRCRCAARRWPQLSAPRSGRRVGSKHAGACVRSLRDVRSTEPLTAPPPAPACARAEEPGPALLAAEFWSCGRSGLCCCGPACACATGAAASACISPHGLMAGGSLARLDRGPMLGGGGLSSQWMRQRKRAARVMEPARAQCGLVCMERNGPCLSCRGGPSPSSTSCRRQLPSHAPAPALRLPAAAGCAAARPPVRAAGRGHVLRHEAVVASAVLGAGWWWCAVGAAGAGAGWAGIEQQRGSARSSGRRSRSSRGSRSSIRNCQED
jgi:hypothetical protein